MAVTPETIRAMNHTTMTGPNAHATRSVPRAWNVKRPIAIIPATIIRMIVGV